MEIQTIKNKGYYKSYKKYGNKVSILITTVNYSMPVQGGPFVMMFCKFETLEPINSIDHLHDFNYLSIENAMDIGADIWLIEESEVHESLIEKKLNSPNFCSSSKF